jgi:predicted RNA binding protein YcfA (HicA-like mRNA interferase family)
MKRTKLIRHLESKGCAFYREGANHTLYKNLANGKFSTVPRHKEVDEDLVKKICKDLDIPRP